jgi:hypothetical protein
MGLSCGTHRGEGKVLVGNQKERVCLEELAVDGKLVFVGILNKWDLMAWTGFIWCRQEKVVGSCKHGNESAGFIICLGFLD